MGVGVGVVVLKLNRCQSAERNIVKHALCSRRRLCVPAYGVQVLKRGEPGLKERVENR